MMWETNEVARAHLVQFLHHRYGMDFHIEKVWKSDHSSMFDCSYEYSCGNQYHSGYWNAWTIVKGKRTRWFYSYNKRTWLRGRLKWRVNGT